MVFSGIKPVKRELKRQESKHMKETQRDGKNEETPLTPWAMFLLFFKIGIFTIGGGYAMLPLIERKIVEEKKWVDKNDFLDNLSISQSIPGPIVVNFSLLTGYRLKGLIGGAFSLLGAVIPSFIVILIIALFLWQYHEIPIVQDAFKGMRPAVAALIAFAALRLGKQLFKSYISLVLFIIFFTSLVLINAHPLIIILVAALIGLLLNRIKTGEK